MKHNFFRSLKIDMSRHLLILIISASVSACALQPPASTSVTRIPERWNSDLKKSSGNEFLDANQLAIESLWWKNLDDEIIDEFIPIAIKNSPTIANAIARVDEARAQLSGADASYLPKINAEEAYSSGNGMQMPGSISSTQSNQITTTSRLSLSWEVDLFGRLKHASAAAKNRFAATKSDEALANLLLQTSVANSVINYRSCMSELEARTDDVRSRLQTTELTVLRELAGQVAAMEVARARSSYAESARLQIANKAQCSIQLQALSTLTGVDVSDIQMKVKDASLRQIKEVGAQNLSLPGSIILKHPTVVSALRTADANFEEIGLAKANRWPSLSVSSILESTRLAGVLTNSRTQGANLTGAIFDGGRGSANTKAANARYAQSVAQVEKVVRGVIEEVENSIIQWNSAKERQILAQSGLLAADLLLKSSESSFKAGRMSLFELEDARRTLNNARIAEIETKKEMLQSWISLVRATGQASNPITKNLSQSEKS